jgi:hypothetical protein
MGITLILGRYPLGVCSSERALVNLKHRGPWDREAKAIAKAIRTSCLSSNHLSVNKDSSSLLSCPAPTLGVWHMVFWWPGQKIIAVWVTMYIVDKPYDEKAWVPAFQFLKGWEWFSMENGSSELPTRLLNTATPSLPQPIPQKVHILLHKDPQGCHSMADRNGKSIPDSSPLGIKYIF